MLHVLQHIQNDQENMAGEYIAQLHQLAQAVKSLVLPLDLQEIRHSDPNHFTASFLELYRSTSFFPDEEVKDKLVTLGFSPFHQRWFIPVEDIVRQLDAITADPETIVLLKAFCLFNIKEHLDAKILTDVIMWLGMTAPLNGNPYVPKVKADFYRIIRRLRDTDGELPKRISNLYDLMMTDLIKRMEEVVGNKKEAHSRILQLSGGNTKVYLEAVVGNCACEKKGDAFYRRFFPLFKLICPDESMLCKKEHDISNHHHGSYGTYQAKRVKDLIGFYDRKHTKNN